MISELLEIFELEIKKKAVFLGLFFVLFPLLDTIAVIQILKSALSPCIC